MVSEPLGHHMPDMPYVDTALIDYQFGQMTMKDKPISNPLLYLMTRFGCHIKTLAIRCMANSGSARDKTNIFVGAQRAYTDGLNMLKLPDPVEESKEDATTKNSTRPTTSSSSTSDHSFGASAASASSLVAFNRVYMIGVLRRYAVTSMKHHLNHVLKATLACIADRNHQQAIVAVSDLIDIAEAYCQTVVSYNMKNAAINIQRTRLKGCCLLGMSLEQIGQYEAAIEAYQQGVALSQDLECYTRDRRNEIKCLMRISTVVMKAAKNATEGYLLGRERSLIVQQACQRLTNVEKVVVEEEEEVVEEEE